MRDARVNQYPETNRSDADWAVAVFAHNEADNIERCLNSIRSHASRRIHAYVLANGCSDETESVVRSYAERNDWVSLVSIARGDKCNAWNVFVHEVAPAAQIHFFMDGDVWAEAGAFDALGDALSSDTRAMAAAAAPSTGRAKAFMEELVCTHRLLLGNLYALRGTFVQAARQAGVRLPIGYVGDDGLVTSLVKWNLDPKGEFHAWRVAPCPQARFGFRSFSLLSPSDWRTYLRRRIRYSRRHFEHELIVPLLRQGITKMPSDVETLYQLQQRQLFSLRPRGGIERLFDSLALRTMRTSLSRFTAAQRSSPG